MNDEGTTRQLVLRHASRLFADHGYEATGTREIAESCGIEQTELFHHFSSKEEIMNTLLKTDLEVALAAAERELESTGSPAVRLYRYLVVDQERACRSPFNFAGLTWPAVRRELSFSGARARHQRLVDARVNLIALGIESGEFVRIDPGAASRSIEWTIEGSLTEAATGPIDTREGVAHQIAGLCLRALLVDVDFLENIRHDFPIVVDEYPAQ
jgi:AcrR family transcriptional regulator